MNQTKERFFGFIPELHSKRGSGRVAELVTIV